VEKAEGIGRGGKLKRKKQSARHREKADHFNCEAVVSKDTRCQKRKKKKKGLKGKEDESNTFGLQDAFLGLHGAKKRRVFGKGKIGEGEGKLRKEIRKESLGSRV